MDKIFFWQAEDFIIISIPPLQLDSASLHLSFMLPVA